MILQPSSKEFQKLLQGYIGALLWAMPGDEGEENPGDKLDASDFSEDAKTVCVADCLEFLNRMQKAGLAPWIWQSGPQYRLSGFDLHSFGHDLALARNGAGAGFFDRAQLDVPADGSLFGQSLGDALHKIAGEMGVRDIYVGDDKKVHAS